MKTNLTDEAIRATVAGLRMSEKAKAALLRRALSGDEAARFAVYAKAARACEICHEFARFAKLAGDPNPERCGAHTVTR